MHVVAIAVVGVVVGGLFGLFGVGGSSFATPLLSLAGPLRASPRSRRRSPRRSPPRSRARASTGARGAIDGDVVALVARRRDPGDDRRRVAVACGRRPRVARRVGRRARRRRRPRAAPDLGRERRRPGRVRRRPARCSSSRSPPPSACSPACSRTVAASSSSPRTCSCSGCRCARRRERASSSSPRSRSRRSITHWALGHIDWRAAFVFALGSVPASWIVSRRAQQHTYRAPPTRVRAAARRLLDLVRRLPPLLQVGELRMTVTHDPGPPRARSVGAARPEGAVLAARRVLGPAPPRRHRGVAARRVRGRAARADADRRAVGCRVGGAGLDRATGARRDPPRLPATRRRRSRRRLPPGDTRSRPIPAPLSRLVAQLQHAPHARAVAEPARRCPRAAGLISPDGHTALDSRRPDREERRRPSGRGRRSSAPTSDKLDARARRHAPRSPANGRCGATSTRSTPKRCTRPSSSAACPRMILLFVAFGMLHRRRLAARARARRHRGRLRAPARARLVHADVGVVDELLDDDRPRGRHRLQPVHRQPLPRGTRRRQGRARRDREHDVDRRQGRVPLRADRRHGARRGVPRAGHGVPVDGARHDPVGRRRRPRVADAAARRCSSRSATASSCARTPKTPTSPPSPAGNAGPASRCAGRPRCSRSVSS